MTNARPSRRQLQQFTQAMQAAQQSKSVTSAWLQELAARRDEHLASLR